MKRKRGFTLIELMIAVAVIALLAAIALPSYQREMRKARRAEAQRIIGEIRMAQERWRADQPTYGALTDVGNPGTGNTYYTFTVTNNTPTTYTISATVVAAGPQAADAEGSTSCSPLTINQAGTKTPAACWSQ